MAKRTIRTRHARERFLEALAKTGNVTVACASAGIGRRSAYDWRDDDEEFAEAWADAIEVHVETLEAECDRRGFLGVEKGIYYQGKRIDTICEYSDQLLMFRLRALDPKYRDRVSAEFSAPGGGPIAFTVTLVGAGQEAAVKARAAHEGGNGNG